METKKAAKHRGSLGGRVRFPSMTEAAFEARSEEIHESLNDAIKKVELGEMNPESAKAILEKIKIVQALLLTAEQDLDGWLQGKKL
jgi:hypothetical protein